MEKGVNIAIKILGILVTAVQLSQTFSKQVKKEV